MYLRIVLILLAIALLANAFVRPRSKPPGVMAWPLDRPRSDAILDRQIDAISIRAIGPDGAIAMFSKETAVPVKVTERAAAAFGDQSEIAVNLPAGRLGDALTALLDHLGIWTPFIVDGDTVVIRPLDVYGFGDEVRVYDLRPLISKVGGNGMPSLWIPGVQAESAECRDLLLHLYWRVAKRSWGMFDGAADMYEFDHLLVVRTSPERHYQLARYLDALRAEALRAR